MKVQGEFDYDHQISRQAYTSYLNIKSLKERIQISVINSKELKNEEGRAYAAPGNSLKSEARHHTQLLVQL